MTENLTAICIDIYIMDFNTFIISIRNSLLRPQKDAGKTEKIPMTRNNGSDTRE